MGGPWLPSATAFFNVFLMASLNVSAPSSGADFAAVDTGPPSVSCANALICGAFCLRWFARRIWF